MPNEDRKKIIRKRLLIIFFVALNVGVIAYTAFSEYRRSQSAADFHDIRLRWVYLLPSLLCVILAIMAEVTKYMIVMRSTCGYADAKLCRRTVLLGRYYDNITPSGIGGQPYQIYYMNKNGVPAAESATIPIAGFLSMQYAFIILAIVCMIFGRAHITSSVLRVAAIIGIVCYALFPTVILLFTFFPRFGEKLTRLVVALLAKLRLVKDREVTANKFVENVRGYSSSFRKLLSRRGLFALIMVLGLIYQALLMSLPYFVIHLFGGNIGFIHCFITVVIIYAAITFIPTPGNSGAAEGVFYAVFAGLSGGYVYWAMLFWRFLVYYVYIIYGVFSYLIGFFRGRRRKEGGDG